MLHRILISACSILIFSVGAMVQFAHAQPPLEAYGKLPSNRSVAVSPNGERAVYLRRQGELEFAGVQDLKTNTFLGGMNIGDTKTQRVFFLSDDYAILRASETTSLYGFRGEFEYSAAFS